MINTLKNDYVWKRESRKLLELLIYQKLKTLRFETELMS